MKAQRGKCEKMTKHQRLFKFLQVVVVFACLVVVLPIVGDLMPFLHLNTPEKTRAGDQDASAATGQVSAEELSYSKAVKDAEQSNEPRPKVYQDYGNFLSSQNRLSEAAAVYKQGAAHAKKYKLPDFESTYLFSEAHCQYDLWRAGESDKPDLALAERAWQLRKDSGKDDAGFMPFMYLTLGNVYSANGEYTKAQSFLNRSLQELQRVKDDEMVIDVVGEKIRNLVRSGNYVEANKLYIKEMSDHEKDAYQITDAFRKALRLKEATAAGIFPKTKKLLAARKFVELDQYADQLRASQASFPSGRWYIDVFDEQLTLESKYPDARWQSDLETFNQWVKEIPDSSTAKIALANELTGYAWKARGGGWASGVTRDGWKLFGQRLEMAQSVLQQVKAKPPDWYAVSQKVALGQGWSRDKYESMMNECLQKYPKYYTVIFHEAWFLQPRWHGSPGQAEKFQDDQASKLSPEQGDILYAQATWSLDSTMFKVFSKTKLSWPRTKAGLLAIIKKDPGAIYARGQLSILAVQVGDMPTAQSAFADSQSPSDRSSSSK